MKYKIRNAQDDKGFKPFSVTLTFETRKEYMNFHDNVMSKITETNNHPFHGAIYDAGNGNIDIESTGKI